MDIGGMLIGEAPVASENEPESDPRHPVFTFEVTGYFGPPWRSFNDRPHWWKQEDYDAAKATWRVGRRFAHIPESLYLRYRVIELTPIEEAERGRQYRGVYACDVCSPHHEIIENRPVKD